jgi:hypothetical protein
MQRRSSAQGYSSGLRLLQATCKVFAEYCKKNNLTVQNERGFRMTYETDIPRMVSKIATRLTAIRS